MTNHRSNSNVQPIDFESSDFLFPFPKYQGISSFKIPGLYKGVSARKMAALVRSSCIPGRFAFILLCGLVTSTSTPNQVSSNWMAVKER